MNYPKLQYSYFLENGAQVVIRGETKDEFVLDVEWAKSLFPAKTSLPSDRVPAETKAKTTPTEECPICHSPAWVNEGAKNGRPWKYRKCVKDKEHINWYDFELDGWRGL